MTHTYSVTGMTCGKCEAKVKSALLTMPDVLSAEVSKSTGTATIEMSKHISLAGFQQALGGEASEYTITPIQHSELAEQTKSWLATYKPVLLIFLYITGSTLLIQAVSGSFSFMQWMQHFMAGFFLVFSFFKLLDLKGFAESYSMYDIVAKQWFAWGYLYAFMELALGAAFLTGFHPFITNMVTLLVMTISIIGVIKSFFSKQTIRCACLGAVFNLPMSTITIAEDTLMIVMSATMLLML